MEASGFTIWPAGSFADALRDVEAFAVKALSALQDRELDEHEAAARCVTLLDLVRAAEVEAEALDEALCRARFIYDGRDT
jgi:hypothetical protein